MQTVQITESPQPTPASPSGFAFSGLQKGILLVIILGVLYLRLALRRRKRDLVCPHCGKRNPHHLTHCRSCSAPLFRG
ncbi:hypothetical protein [Holophaga foetida]|uniref:hypothetical protein n=1 Tax=Holophaga foetida TaxID=35839 RepID=UPI0002474617|nr:hypothetical protein [Holophaga foetida]